MEVRPVSDMLVVLLYIKCILTKPDGVLITDSLRKLQHTVSQLEPIAKDGRAPLEVCADSFHYRAVSGR